MTIGPFEIREFSPPQHRYRLVHTASGLAVVEPYMIWRYSIKKSMTKRTVMQIAKRLLEVAPEPMWTGDVKIIAEKTRVLHEQVMTEFFGPRRS